MPYAKNLEALALLDQLKVVDTVRAMCGIARL
jgi:hypothetical protein